MAQAGEECVRMTVSTIITLLWLGGLTVGFLVMWKAK